jgi:hypothetical protein
MGCTDLQDFQATHKRWVEQTLQPDKPQRQKHWTESIAVGSKSFIEEVKNSLGFRAKGRSITSRTDHYELRENIYNFGNTTLSGSDLSKRSDSDANNSFVWSDVS